MEILTEVVEYHPMTAWSTLECYAQKNWILMVVRNDHRHFLEILCLDRDLVGEHTRKWRKTFAPSWIRATSTVLTRVVVQCLFPVIRPYCTSQPQFGLDVPSILPSVPNPFLDRGFTHLELMTKNFMSGHSGYMSSENSASEGQTLGSVSAEPESSSSDFFYIKRENRGFESVRTGDLSGGSSGSQRAAESAAYGTSRSKLSAGSGDLALTVEF